MSKVEDYISSGILESYVMGLTSNWENLQVEAMIAKHPEIKQEVEAIEANLLSLAQAAAVKPHADLKENIFAAIEGRPVPKIERKKEEEVKVIDINVEKPAAGNNTIWKWAVAASVTLLLGSAAFNYYLYGKLEDSNSHLAHLTNEHSDLNKNFASLQTNYGQSTEQLKIYQDANSKMICLTPVSDSSSLAHIYWNQNAKTVFVEVNNLPLAADTMQYELWAIHNGTPQSIGLLPIDHKFDPVIQMSNVDSAQAFAITLEKKGGVLTPAGQMYVLGKI